MDNFTSTRNATDEMGRPVIESMTLEEKVDEILVTMRGVNDALMALQSNPMIRAMMPKF